jgi:hypothetical protein
MKKTAKQWLEGIPATRSRKGKDNWVTAFCPICRDPQDATVLASDALAEASAKGKVLAHIRRAHKDCVDEPTTAA